MRWSPLFVLLASACSPQYVQVEAPEGRAVVLRAGTGLLDDLAYEIAVGDDFVDVIGTDELPFGSVVVGQRQGGYLRRVVDSEPIADGWHLSTEPATLRDALLEAHVTMEVPVSTQRSSHWDFAPVTLVDDQVTSPWAPPTSPPASRTAGSPSSPSWSWTSTSTRTPTTPRSAWASTWARGST